ncbi:hypothetical protein AVEN_123024-1 [Araneus ventricosus]|uniref:Uncharacterized protein n=1 Tax=Araneus ventricosus TaxID=182803 RepID=A0A4Y2NTL5_ARAVE|nr:hypothetical protein AVEN_123024-1 [Araneus ventricosus]
MGKIWFFQMYACHFQCLALSLANDIFKGICYLLNRDDKSFGIIGRRGIKTLSLLPISAITVAFTTFVPSCFKEADEGPLKDVRHQQGEDALKQSEREENILWRNGRNCLIAGERSTVGPMRIRRFSEKKKTDLKRIQNLLRGITKVSRLVNPRWEAESREMA